GSGRLISHPRGFAPRTPPHALSLAASPARSVRVARSRCSLAASKHSGNLHPTHEPAHLLLDRFVHFPLRVVDRREDQVLKHLDVVFRHGFGIDLDRLHLLGAVHDDSDHATAGGGLDAHLFHLLLHARLHLLRLLHHLLYVHGSRPAAYISSMSLISAAKTSSIAWTPLSASARSLSSCFRSGPTAAPFAAVVSTKPAGRETESPVGGGPPPAPPTPSAELTLIFRPARRPAVSSSHERICSNCARSARCCGANTKLTASGCRSIRCACATTVP